MKDELWFSLRDLLYQIRGRVEYYNQYPTEALRDHGVHEVREDFEYIEEQLDDLIPEEPTYNE